MKNREPIAPQEPQERAPMYDDLLAALNKRQLAGYATSMLVHMTLLLLLALIAFAPRVDQPPQELALDPYEEISEAEDESIDFTELDVEPVTELSSVDPSPPALPVLTTARVEQPMSETQVMIPAAPMLSDQLARSVSNGLGIVESEDGYSRFDRREALLRKG
jgi:hypothetical protein